MGEHGIKRGRSGSNMAANLMQNLNDALMSFQVPGPVQQADGPIPCMFAWHCARSGLRSRRTDPMYVCLHDIDNVPGPCVCVLFIDAPQQSALMTVPN